MRDLVKANQLQFDLIMIGHQRANVYFGDDPRSPPRGKPVTCTSSLIRGLDWSGEPFCLLIDPTLREKPEDFYFELYRRTGLRPSEITACFSTHEHFDHLEGLSYFPNAKWFVGKTNLPWASSSMIIDKYKLIGVEGELYPGVFVVPLPGHTNTLHGISFMLDDKSYIVAGDAVVTRYHFKDFTNNYEDDAEAARQTQLRIKQEYDVVVPGHDNLIIIK